MGLSDAKLVNLFQVRDFLKQEELHSENSIIGKVDRKIKELSEVINDQKDKDPLSIGNLTEQVHLFNTEKLSHLINRAAELDKEIGELTGSDLESIAQKCMKINELNQILNEIAKEQNRLGKGISKIAENSILKTKLISEDMIDSTKAIKVDLTPYLEEIYDKSIFSLSYRMLQNKHKYKEHKVDSFISLLKQNITDDNLIVEFCKIAAKHRNVSDFSISNHIHKFGIKDQAKLCEIAKIAASNNGSTIYNVIKNYGLTEKNELFEIAKLVLVGGGSSIVSYLDDYEIKSEEKLFEFAKFYASQDGKGVSRDIQRFGIKSEAKLFEVAKIAAANNGGGVSEYIARYGIKDQELLFEIAKIDLAKDGYNSEYIENYGIEDQEKLFELAKIAAGNNGRGTSIYIERYGIKDKIKLLEVAKIAAINDPKETLSRIERYGINYSGEDDVKIMEIFNNFARTMDLPEGCLEWFRVPLEGLDNPEQKKENVLWLAGLLSRCTRTPLLSNIFREEEAIRTLKMLANSPNPRIKKEASDYLLTLYQDNEMKNDWNSRFNPKREGIGLNQQKTSLSDHLLIPNLFLSFTTNDNKLIDTVLSGLSSTYYSSYDVLNPINELLLMLSHCTVNLQMRGKLLQLILPAQQKEEGEKEKDFQLRLQRFRADQMEMVVAVRDLLFLEKGYLLKGEEDRNTLISTWEKVCREMFGVVGDKNVLLKFMDTFQNSKRYPGGLLSYAARLNTLDAHEKNKLIPLLGEFANAVLQGTYPDIRYDLSKNEHLKIIFGENNDLLKKWRGQLSFKAVDFLNKAPPTTIKKEEPQEFVARLLRQSLHDRHLGEDQTQQYPKLFALVFSKKAEEFKTALEDIIKQEKTLALKMQQLKQMKTPESQKELADLERTRKRIVIEKLCLQLLSPDIKSTKVLEHLQALAANLENLKDLPLAQFKQDVDGMLGQLKPSKDSNEKLVVQDTDEWEDMLLMGTEVISCQKIDGNEFFNKCLLAYIHDGKNKALVVKDDKNRIVARAVLRLLVDEKTMEPVLFLERTYTATNNPALQELIREGALRKAKGLGIVMVASPKDYLDAQKNKLYGSKLQALGGPAPYEYVDALNGIQSDGKFTIDQSYVLFQPSEQHA